MTSKFVLLRCAATALLLARLGGCAQDEASHQQELAAQAQAEEAEDDAACRSDGTPVGSPTYAQCRMRFYNRREHERAVVAATLLK